MELINKQKTQTTYTIEFTSEELNLVVAALGNMSTVKLKELFKKDYNHKQDLNDPYELWTSLENISEMQLID